MFHDFCETFLIVKLNPRVEIINVSVNDERLERYTGTLITYLLNLEHEEKNS